MKHPSKDMRNRLIPLPDGRPGLRTSLSIAISEPPSEAIQNQKSKIENPTDACILDFVASDETLDRYSEIISASGWNLANYQKNPVFQNSHQYGDVLFTLGRALVTEVRGGKLMQRIQFATDTNPMAKIAYGLYKGKFLNAVSVGFIPLRWEDPPPSSADFQSAVPTSLENQNSKIKNHSPRRRYLEQELLEVSAVSIPANPNALALGLKSGAVEKSDLRALVELVRFTIDRMEPQIKNQNSKIENPLHLLRELNSILKSA